jgi:murein DD-endopeptidase MepM/ murein hydrolase activator NlpD
MQKSERKLSDRLRDKYRLIIYNDNTFEEMGFVRLKGFNLLWIIGALGFLLISLTFILIAYTSIRELIPGYPDNTIKREMVMNALKLDSLEHELEIRDRYLAVANDILKGNNPASYGEMTKDSVKIKEIIFTKSPKDSLLRRKVEEEEQFNFASNPAINNNANQTLAQVHFFSPLRGIISNGFNPNINHIGVDIVSEPNAVIKAALDGTVIMAAWTLETGYVIQIQHDNNIITVYKHNAELLKQIGNRVVAGEPIAIVGNSGEISTGPHLHFELWNNGHPVNPVDYIVF